ncbi:hypothetical protein H4R35_006152 [Dimargaris xerosporica]|nr:hypothetical protein H4R35_006152 [Dimargaris xerosporica]
MRSIPLLALTLAVLGEPHVASSMRTTRNVTFFTPERPHAVYVMYTTSPALPLLPELNDLTVRAVNLAKTLYALNDDDIVVKDSHLSKDVGVTHIYLRQRINGREITNADMNVNIDRNGNIMSYGSSFISQLGQVPSIQVALGDQLGQAQAQGPVNAIQTVLHALRHTTSPESTMLIEGQDDETIAVTNVPGSIEPKNIVRPVYLIDEESKLVPAWEVTLRTLDDWVVGHVNQGTANLASLISWRSDAVYNVYGMGESDPAAGRRAMYSNPAHPRSSPHGWHDNQRDKPFTTTQGNNAVAQQASVGDNWRTRSRPDGGHGLVFNFPVDLRQKPEAYTDAAVVNAFYWVNIVHDIFYQYGFTEEAGNFQQNNFGRGGQDNDPILAFVQDRSGTNNAYFVTPPDGQAGEMHMFSFTQSTPHRDGDLDASILIHELSHGVSTRLTGGPGNSNCLQGSESNGLGEGWSDFFAITFQLQPNAQRTDKFIIAAYANNNDTSGIRHYPYTSTLALNPLTYDSLNNPAIREIHYMGEVWASMLHEVLWNMIEEAGLEPNVYNANSSRGNILALKYVMLAFKLQPCDPNFISARDAILQAERAITQSRYQCALWEGFASRGLGVSAGQKDGQYTASEEVPSHCQ